MLFWRIIVPYQSQTFSMTARKWIETLRNNISGVIDTPQHVANFLLGHGKSSSAEFSGRNDSMYGATKDKSVSTIRFWSCLLMLTFNT